MAPLNKSFEYLARAKQVIPLQSQTFSKAPTWFVQGVYPVYLQRGDGCLVWDVDGNEFVDFIMALGPITLGYNYPLVNEAIIRQLEGGIIFSLPHPLEVELAELLRKIIPCARMVRFLKTGSEACQAAIRVARAYTGRYDVAYRGYHGWHEWYSVTTERPKGIPPVYEDYMFQFDYNDLESLESILKAQSIAAVIMEPAIFELPHKGFLDGVRYLTQKYGALLIFDETITGFRMALGGAQQYFGVTPDLAVFGKGMANGMPLAVVCGRKDIMREFEDVFVSSTFGGECLSLAAAKATITEMQEKRTIEHVWKMGDRLLHGLWNKGIKTTGYPCRPAILLPSETPAIRSLFMQECLKRGLLTHSFGLNLCYSHTQGVIDQTIRACGEAYALVLEAQEKGEVEKRLEGKVIQPAFRRL